MKKSEEVGIVFPTVLPMNGFSAVSRCCPISQKISGPSTVTALYNDFVLACVLFRGGDFGSYPAAPRIFFGDQFALVVYAFFGLLSLFLRFFEDQRQKC